MAKAAYWTVTDVEARKRGEQTGLDTLVVLPLVRVNRPGKGEFQHTGGRY